MSVSKISLLVVDDHTAVRKAFLSLFEDSSFSVVADTGQREGVVDLVRQHAPDVVLLDLCLPDKDDGIAAARDILSSFPDAKILVLSGLIRESLVNAMFRIGVLGYVSKICAIPELKGAVREVALGRRFLCSESSKAIAMDRVDSDSMKTRPPAAVLSNREYEVMLSLCSGKTTKEIAYDMDICVRTVSTHRESVMRKLNMSNIVDLIRYALKRGIVT